MEKTTSLNVYLHLYTELLLQLKGLYASVWQELRKMCGAIFELTTELASLLEQIDSVVLTFDDNRMLQDLLKHQFFCLSQELDAQMEGPPRPVMDRKMDIVASFEACIIPSNVPLCSVLTFYVNKNLFSILGMERLSPCAETGT